VTDGQLRELARRFAASGDPVDEARLLAERLRTATGLRDATRECRSALRRWSAGPGPGLGRPLVHLQTVLGDRPTVSDAVDEDARLVIAVTAACLAGEPPPLDLVQRVLDARAQTGSGSSLRAPVIDWALRDRSTGDVAAS
jgi:hypothetical protein